MISVKSSGDFKNTQTFLVEHKKSMFTEDEIYQIADKSIELFKKNTPSNSGKTAESWEYVVYMKNGEYIIDINNTNIQNGLNIAILVDSGHAIQSGGWVSGKYYIDNTIKEIFEYVNKFK